MTFNKLHTLQNVNFVPYAFYNSKFNSTFDMATHAHKTIEIMYCRSGEFDVEFHPETQRSRKTTSTVHINAKQFILIDAGIKHRVIINGKEPVIIMCVEWASIPLKETDNQLKPYLTMNTRALFDKLEGLKRFTYNSDSYVVASDSANLESTLVHYIYLLSLKNQTVANECSELASFLQLIVEIDKSLLPSNFSTGIIYIKKAQDFIKNNFQRDISVGEIANASGINKAYLQRLFKTHVGMSIIQSLNNFRIEKCKQLLIETNLTINEICEHTGFNNRQHLIYEFKMQTGTTPTSFRNEFMNNPNDRNGQV